VRSAGYDPAAAQRKCRRTSTAMREHQIHDEVVQADLLLTLQKGPFKLFGEYLISDHEGIWSVSARLAAVR